MSFGFPPATPLHRSFVPVRSSELRRLLMEHPEIETIGEAAEAEEALAIIQKHEPDLIFLDIEMPGMTGFDLLDVPLSRVRRQ
jgi:DNA-binding NarL/FixJ family response regulator